MQAKLLTGQNSKYFFFPDNKETLLSRGKFSLVFLGAELNSKEKIIVKQLSPSLFHNNYAKQKFFFEASFNIKNPNFAKNIDLIIDNNEIFLIQEYIPGPTLADLIYNKQYYNYRFNSLFIKIIISCLDALSFLHKQNFCHCDLKPSNIIIHSKFDEFDINDPTIKIIDFGQLRKSFSEEDTDGQYQTYNMLYASPEQIFGFSELIGEHTDIFSMGLILYEAIAKEPALKIDNPIIYRRMQTSVPIAKHFRISDEIHAIISKATNKAILEKAESYYCETDLKILTLKAMSQRYQSTEKFKEDLITLL